ncbi:Hypothetical protein FKW44_001492 [Caligus rogercresseyi]|uniref:CCHC-type domain-containing protein n=1 Tax=Caligus rogercresseyi TaxID=217165 RepID=A0A7T8QVL2_CALRO|nr:Hypothetical protein FKW44_001492 [Caligus rogercresseyi]
MKREMILLSKFKGPDPKPQSSERGCKWSGRYLVFDPKLCPAKEANCNRCEQTGHLAKCCMKLRQVSRYLPRGMWE